MLRKPREAFNPGWEFGGIFPGEAHVWADSRRVNESLQGNSHIYKHLVLAGFDFFISFTYKLWRQLYLRGLDRSHICLNATDGWHMSDVMLNNCKLLLELLLVCWGLLSMSSSSSERPTVVSSQPPLLIFQCGYLPVVALGISQLFALGILSVFVVK